MARTPLAQSIGSLHAARLRQHQRAQSSMHWRSNTTANACSAGQGKETAVVAGYQPQFHLWDLVTVEICGLVWRLGNLDPDGSTVSALFVGYDNRGETVLVQ